jgi:hypothetical protein
MQESIASLKELAKTWFVRRACAALALLIAGAPGVVRAQGHGPLLLRDPSISKTQIAFSYAGSILDCEPRRQQRGAADQRRPRRRA